jgi:aspartyl-tRNA(Asn)/glutamyl-tRNA(Gln) amidotransferase subunit A
MKEILELTMAEALEKLTSKEISATELTKAYIAQIEAHKDLNAFITETPEIALEQAKESDERYAKGQARPMEGMPIGMKDLYCTEGILTTAGSKILDNFVPSYESTVSGNLKKAGCVMLGKLNMDEFAMGSANLTSAYGPVKSPWKSLNSDADLVPGGSSGGASAAVAAKLAIAATGSDTGGSIRQPAAFCGIVGMKPTYGVCSRYGMVAFASSLDQAGPMTRTVHDAAIMLQAMASHDPKDATSSPKKPCENYVKELNGDIRGKKIGIPKEYRLDGINPRIAKMWDESVDLMKQAGVEIVDISLPHTKYALPTYYIIAPAEASSNLARYDGVRYGHRMEGKTLDELYEKTRAAGFGEEVRNRIMIGTYVLSAGYFDAYFLKAQKVRRLIRQDFDNVFRQVDLILAPSTPNGAFEVNSPPTDPIEMYMNDVLTVPINLAGLPAISVPAGLTDDGRPLGMQLIGPAFHDHKVLQAAEVLETAVDFSAKCKKLGNT